LWVLDFLEEVGSHGLTRGSVWKASTSRLVAAEALDVQGPPFEEIVKNEKIKKN